MGPSPSRHLRLCASRREAFADPKRGAHRNGNHLDEVVPDYQAQELPVCFSFLLPPSFHPHEKTNPPTPNSLAAVNFFLGMVGIVQVSRIVMWQQAQKKLEAEAAVAAPGGVAKVEEVPVKA